MGEETDTSMARLRDIAIRGKRSSSMQSLEVSVCGDNKKRGKRRVIQYKTDFLERLRLAKEKGVS